MNLSRLSLLLIASAAQSTAPAQPQPETQPQQVWQMQESGTTAGLRGIDSVDGTVAWASGTGGIILRTTDAGAHWQKCAVPDGDKDGATLDFRGVQAFDASNAIVMSSGMGRLSRLYKTKDSCHSWKRIFTNPNKDGFWDALYFEQRHATYTGRSASRSLEGWLLGDPAKGEFSLFRTHDSGEDWYKQKNRGLRVKTGTQGAFAASNSSLIAASGVPLFGSGGTGGAFVYSISQTTICLDDCPEKEMNLDGRQDKWIQQSAPLEQGTGSAGVVSIGERSEFSVVANSPKVNVMFVAVGGDYTKPNDATGTAAWSSYRSEHWTASTVSPHGYRSTVQWSESLKLWITAGTNGSDISRDDGRTWQPLDNGNWNALSLPFVVGPNGRIARLNPAALPPTKP